MVNNLQSMVHLKTYYKITQQEIEKAYKTYNSCLLACFSNDILFGGKTHYWRRDNLCL